jgi:hypothetical protein
MVKKSVNARGKLSPELMVVKCVDDDYPEDKEAIPKTDAGDLHRSILVLDRFV